MSSNTPTSNEIQDKINMLLDKEFFARDESLILLVGDRLLNAAKQGEYIPYFPEIVELLSQYNSTINRLSFSEPITEPPINDETPPNNDLIKYKIDVKNVALYKGTDDNKMMIFIDGNMLPA